MSLSFYYVATYNVQHPTVNKFVGGLFAVSESVMEFKIRSKLYHDYAEVTNAAHTDFDMKCDKMYSRNEIDTKDIRWVTAINPLCDPDIEQAAESFVTSDWETNCAGSIFFIEGEADDEEEDEDSDIFIEPHSWMFKYELYFVEDTMEVPVNGESAISPTAAGITTSTYH
jgi:hypothetical protein